MLNDRYYTDSGIDDIPIMCDRGCVTNGDDTVRDINTVPTNRLLKGEVFFSSGSNKQEQPAGSADTRCVPNVASSKVKISCMYFFNPRYQSYHKTHRNL